LKQRGLKKTTRENGPTPLFSHILCFKFDSTQLQENSVSFCRLLALRKAEKEEERRARERIKQKLEEDKV